MHDMSQNKNGIFSSIFGLNLGHRILSHIDSLSTALQAKKCQYSVVKCYQN